MAQELYDGQGKKVITYPRAEVRYLPESLIGNVPKIVAALQVGQSFKTIPVRTTPIIRRGAAIRAARQGTRWRDHITLSSRRQQPTRRSLAAPFD